MRCAACGYEYVEDPEPGELRGTDRGYKGDTPFYRYDIPRGEHGDCGTLDLYECPQCSTVRM